jgi:hypothetical protein
LVFQGVSECDQCKNKAKRPYPNNRVFFQIIKIFKVITAGKTQKKILGDDLVKIGHKNYRIPRFS